MELCEFFFVNKLGEFCRDCLACGTKKLSLNFRDDDDGEDDGLDDDWTRTVVKFLSQSLVTSKTSSFCSDCAELNRR